MCSKAEHIGQVVFGDARWIRQGGGAGEVLARKRCGSERIRGSM